MQSKIRYQQYPTKEEVNEAGPQQLSLWWDYLAEPQTEEQVEIYGEITEKYREACRGLGPMRRQRSFVS